MQKAVFERLTPLFSQGRKFIYWKMLSNTPAATAEPITPATFGPIACMSRKFEGFSFAPSSWETLAAIGTADTPAEPIRGLILPPESLYITFPSSTPPAVPIENAIRPSAIIIRVLSVKKLSAVAVAPTTVPSMMVTIFISSLEAVFPSLQAASLAKLSLNGNW